MLALHSDHQRQMMSVIDMTSASERETSIATSQKNSIKTKNIHEKLNKLQVLYELNERRNNELMLWEKMKRLTEMIEKLTRQRVAALTVNQCMKNQLKRLKKIMSRLEKKFAKKKRRVDNWVKRVNEKSTTLFESHLVLSVNVALSVQNYCKKFKIKIFIKEKEKIKRIMMTTTENIVRWVREIDVDETLLTRKNIETIKRWSNLLIFWVKIEDSKKILKKNDFWIKEISSNASLHEVSFKIVIHEIKVEEMFKDIEKKKTKVLIKINKDIHLKMMIEKVKWLTKNSEQKRYILLMIRVVSAEMTNKLINEKIYHKINIKITQFYDLNCRTHQCLKYQDYNHKTYKCRNKQRCIYCALNHRSKHCFYKQTWNMWKCETCWNTHRVFDSQCHKQQIEKERIKRVMKHRSLYHVVWEQKELKAMMLKTFIKIFISLRSLIDNDLKRKQRRSINESHLLSVIITFENIILNHLVKKSKINELKSTSITSISVSSSFEDFTRKASTSQMLKRTSNSFECKL